MEAAKAQRDRRVRLAVRFLRHRARPLTLQEWCWVSGEQVNTLREKHGYLPGRKGGAPPQRFSRFFATPAGRSASTLFANIYVSVGRPLRSCRGPRGALEPCVENGEPLALAYEIFPALYTGEEVLDFDEAVLLAKGCRHGG